MTFLLLVMIQFYDIHIRCEKTDQPILDAMSSSNAELSSENEIGDAKSP